MTFDVGAGVNSPVSDLSYPLRIAELIVRVNRGVDKNQPDIIGRDRPAFCQFLEGLGTDSHDRHGKSLKGLTGKGKEGHLWSGVKS